MGIVLLVRSFDCSLGCVVSITPLPNYIHESSQMPIEMQLSWASGTVWIDTEKKKFCPHRDFEPRENVQQLKRRYTSYAILALPMIY